MKLIFKNLFFICFLCTNLQSFAYEKVSDGLVFTLTKLNDTDAHLMKIQVLSDEIIRVIASPSNSFSDRLSLMRADYNWEPVKWTVQENGEYVELSTSKLKVRVNPVNGAVSFYDNAGNVLLKEKSESGKFISSAEVMGEQTFHVQQLFDSPEDEAFYGLGSHQNGLWNYKGNDVDLWQLNIIDVIPFLVSSNNYGILWDNNSKTKFGDIREYGSISSLKLFDKDGMEGGLSAEYFKDSGFELLSTSRKESRIDHEFLDVNDDYPEGFQRDVKAVRWSGEIQSDITGIHKFRLYSSGYTKMWLNGELIADSWRQNWLPWTHMPRLNMEAGKKYKIKIEWIHTGGYISLKYLSPEEDIYKSSLSLYSEVADQIDYYFVYGKNTDDIIKGYRKLTGKAPMMPKWAMGFWQCRERYKTQDELLSVVTEFRKREIPIDNIVQDWFYWEEDKWGDHEFDNSRFPDAKGMVEKLHDDLNAHIMISVWPKFYVGTKNYEEFDKNGWLYKGNVEKQERDWVGKGYFSTFYDPYSSGASDLFWKGINEKLFSFGFDAWWLDATEPDIHSNLSHNELLLRIGPTALGSSARYLNTYSLMNSKGVYEGQRASDPDKRVFILTRSAFAGQQRYSAATWSGDIASRWEDLKNQIPAGLNFTISGIPYWTTDIGGFAVEPRYERPNEKDLEEWRELNTRWFQYGTFCPLFRVHGQFPFREIFNVAPAEHPAYQSMLKYDKLRYRLMPYIYSLTGAVTHDDYTIMRALVMDFSQDKNVKEIGDQFMFGPAFMINPVTDYKKRSRNVYLPAFTGWYDMTTGQFYEGGQTIEAHAPYSDIPIFIKQGSIIPCGPEMQYTSEKPADPVKLFVYTGADGSFQLYEDEGTNYNYEKGLFSTIRINYTESTRTLSIDKRSGEYPGMLKNRTFEVVWISKDNSKGMDFNLKPDTILKYNGEPVEVRFE